MGDDTNEPTREQLDAWLTEHCGTGLPYGEATDRDTALHGLAYVLSQIEGTSSYRVHIGQCNSATSSLRWALDFIAASALRAAPPAMDREAVAKLVEPLADYHGDLPDYDHWLRPIFDSGIQYAVELLAKELGVKEWEPCDGTEEFDGDLGGTLTNIVLEAMPKDEDGDPIHPRDLLSTLSADAIRQGEGFSWPEPKFVPIESGAKLNPERVEAAFQLINGEMVIGEQFQLIEMMLDGTDYTIVPATPASHASDGGKA